MRDLQILVQQTVPQEECVVLLRSLAGFHILNAPLDLTDEEILDVLCAAQDIITQRIALAQQETTVEPNDESEPTDANV